MTITVAWTRKAGNNEELVFASDSRLRAFGSWDANPKIFLLDRTDCAIAFAGDTHFSYPLISQIQTFIRAYPRSQNRFQDLCHFKGHLLNMMNFMLSHKSDYEVPRVNFLFGGYSWARKHFYLWNIFFDKNIKGFSCAEVRRGRDVNTNRVVTNIGNYRREFRSRLINLMRTKRKYVRGYFDMEPFEVLRDMIKENNHEDIGGPPQLLKVYEHMNRTPIAVKWKIGKNKISTLLGRPLQDYEVMDYPQIDAATLVFKGGTLFG